jgi:coenzyme F420-dependent glucose-6-phosphate dehydrogenase
VVVVRQGVRGSGEAVNEVPLGADWPSPAEQIERMDQGLDAITRQWDGATVTVDAGWFRLKDAKLYTCAALAGKDEGEIIVQVGPRRRKATQLPEVYRDPLHDPAEMLAEADERVSDEELAHERIREMESLGATVVSLQLIGSANPMGSIRRYGDEVLPTLRTRQR